VGDQCRVFEEATRDLAGERTLANSAALLRHAHTHADWVRPGIALYGSTPDPQDHTAPDWGLQAVMSLRSKVIAVQELQVGDSVGYGSTFVAERPTRVGVVACGYADGYPRHAQTGTPVLIDGQRSRTLGRVSMDMLAVDLTPCREAREGAEVTLWGRAGGGALLPIDEVAQAAGTLGYELMCALAARVPVEVRDPD
jgi:alanine racemase